ncbi:MAG: FAD-dependent oxidoreductase [Pseudomonadota bacterium]
MSATSPDVLIVGGGIVGLWCAARAVANGLSCTLVDQGGVGQGASGGLLGALMPHQPTNWNDVKQFQLDALLQLESDVATLEAQTGLSCGYRRCGRLIPVRTQQKHAMGLTMVSAARISWPASTPGGTALSWQVEPHVPDPSWLSPEVAPLGCEYETLSGRVDPRSLLAALKAFITSRIDLREHTFVSTLAPEPRVVLADGAVLTPGHVIMAAGVATFPLIAPFVGDGIGRGVKGQAALVAPHQPVDPSAPILYDGGLYVIAHGENRVAIGSTSENDFIDGSATDEQLDDLIACAAILCPALERARVVERWAGVRPKAIGRQPIIGPLPDAPGLIVAGGGFKISLGVAHAMADAAIGFATGASVTIPERMTVSDHMARLARGRARTAARVKAG